jgi:thiol-disulfide isomerase/thioredoxin
MSTRRAPGADRRQRFAPVLAVGAALVVVLGWLALRGDGDAGRQQTGRRPAAVGSDVGDLAPRATVRTISGSNFEVPAGKVTVLYFMAGWCEPCLPEAIALGRIQRELGDRIAILAVDADPSDSLGTLREFIRSAGSPAYPFAHDTEGALVTAFAARSLDTTVVIDAAGRIAFRDGVPTDEDTLRAALARAGVP